MVRRDVELADVQPLLHRHGVCQPVYCLFKNGLAYQYAEGAMLEPRQMLQPNIYRRIIARLHAVHGVPVAGDAAGRLSSVTRQAAVLSQLLQTERVRAVDRSTWYQVNLPSTNELVSRLQSAMDDYNSLSSDFHRCLVHGDAHYGNIIYNKQTDEISLIDWDLVGFDFEPVDIAIHWSRDAYFTLEETGVNLTVDAAFQRAWLGSYLASRPGTTAGTVAPTALVDTWQRAVLTCINLTSLISVAWMVQIAADDMDDPQQHQVWRCCLVHYRIWQSCNEMRHRMLNTQAHNGQ